MTNSMHLIEKFFLEASAHKNDVILYSGAKEYTYGDLIERYNLIKENIFQGKHGNILIVRSSDCVELLLHYLLTIEAGISCLLLPPDSGEKEYKNIRRLLKIQENLPLKGIAQLELAQNGEFAESGEVIFRTSGTSGLLRFVRISHEDFFRKMLIRYDYDIPCGIKLLLFPIWKQLGMKELLRSLFFHEQICVLDTIDIVTIRECINQYKFTAMVVNSSTLRGILYDKNFKTEYLNELRVLRFCQEPFLYETLIQIQSLFPNVQVYSDYGLAETIGTIAVKGPITCLENKPGHYLSSIGKFVSGVEIKLMDQEGEEVAPSEIGELMVHSPEQYLGYLGEGPASYWVSTGDMGWFDFDGIFNQSGFHLSSQQNKNGNVFVLPAVERKQYVNMPILEPLMKNTPKATQTYHALMWLIHASLNIDEIRHLYLDMIPEIVEADAYGFELFPLEAQEDSNIMPINQFWYQDALDLTNRRDIFLIDKTSKEQVLFQNLETYYDDAVNILYMPLYSFQSQMHGVISFAKTERKSKFSAYEITILKQVSHQLNLALLNARTIQELQTRQMAFESAIDFSGIGIVLSDLNNTIFYMNSVVKNLIEIEDLSFLQNSSLLENFKENIYNLVASEQNEQSAQFVFYYKKNLMPTLMTIRSIFLAKDKQYVASFISQNLSEDDINFGDLSQNLSAKEREVLTLLCHGVSYKEMAEKMCVSINTINYHVKNIYRKMNVNSRNELLKNILYLGRNGLRFSSKDPSS